MGFQVATPIQTASIPVAMAGRDLIGQAHTGSGKTAAFGIPIVERVEVGGPAAQALILCPTRELCVQVHEELTRLGASRGVASLAIYGGEPIRKQLDALRHRPPVVVATPGRLLDHVSRHSISLASVRIAVLDEADRMLDMGFAPDVERILRMCPTDRQTLLFSATVPEWVRRLSARHMREPHIVAVSTRPEIAPLVRQLYLQVPWSDKVDALSRILDRPDVTIALIFTETKRNADLLEAQLQRRGYAVALLHGDLSQRERDSAMLRFREGAVRILIATNVAARGLDIDDISHVVNFDVPQTPEEYLHRVGRTGRAGREGVAVTLITPSEILRLREVERMARTRIEPASLDDFPAAEAVAAG
ncbi:MAG TPA: DEAD/DEAH box helicase [Candidatus Dormibacteraeota bacterium]|nr:DEAD/DEAH box helicase [Candidatus Dormibacteraeota bacterium]